MSVREYIGARYVPVFADPIEWTDTLSYEPLTVVKYQGSSYVSRRSVPEGIALANTDYWILWADYNAQLEAYRQEVIAYNARITELESDLPITSFSSTNTIKNSIDNINNFIDGIEYAENSNETIVVFSDSTFQSNLNPISDENTKSVVSFMQELTNANVVNYGVEGYSSTNIFNQIATLSDAQKAVLRSASVVIVAMGTNDWQSGYDFLPIIVSSTNTYTNTVKIINSLSLLAPTASIVFVTPGYIHSDIATSVINMNKTGNDFKVYCEAINHACYSHNIACLRLDNVLGINENNYAYKMIPSGSATSAHPEWTNVYVHYNELTNKKIAKLILSNLFNIHAEYNTGKAFDITPYEWLINNSCETKDYFCFGSTKFIHSKTNNNQLTLVTPTLQNEVDYYISFVGGYGNIYLDDTLIASITSQCESCIKIPGNGFERTIKFEKANSQNFVEFGFPKLTINRPDIFDYGFKNNDLFFNSKSPTNIGSDTNNYFTITYTDNFKSKTTHLINKQNITLPANATTPITTLPSAIGKGMFFGVVNITGSGLYPIICRIDNSGKMYLNDITHANQTAITFEGFIIGMQLS